MVKRSKFEHPEVKVELRNTGRGGNPITVEDAKALLGWTVEPEGANWKDWHLKDDQGRKIKLVRTEDNRPLRLTLARRYQSEILRGKWTLNGETFIVDRKGMCQDGQHRLVGVVLAEQLRLTDPDKWGRKPVEVPGIIVYGINEKPETVDTINGGQKRSLGDVLFRRHEFDHSTYKEGDIKKLSNILGYALRLVWLRTGGKNVSDAPHFPLTEAVEFLQKHPRIREAVEFIYAEEGGGGAEGRKISTRVSLGYAAGMLYLMSTARSDPASGEDIDFSLWDEACGFWVKFASGAGLEAKSPILALRSLLEKMDASGTKERDVICGLIVKAWNAYIDGDDITPAKLRIKEKVDKETGKRTLAEEPRIGGLDVAWEPEEGFTPSTAAVKPIKPKKNKGWNKDDTAWFWAEVEDGEEPVALLGKITAIANGVASLTVKDYEDDFQAPLDALMGDKPEDE